MVWARPFPVVMKNAVSAAKQAADKFGNGTGKSYPFDKLPRQAGAGRAGSQGLKRLRENSPLCRPFGTRFAWNPSRHSRAGLQIVPSLRD
jgi:hypothetical protein